MKIYTINHETRCDGNGFLDGETFKSREDAVKAIEKHFGERPEKLSDTGIGWVDSDEYNDEDHIVCVYEQELK